MCPTMGAVAPGLTSSCLDVKAAISSTFAASSCLDVRCLDVVYVRCGTRLEDVVRITVELVEVTRQGRREGTRCRSDLIPLCPCNGLSTITTLSGSHVNAGAALALSSLGSALAVAMMVGGGAGRPPWPRGLVQTGSVHRVEHRLDRFQKPLSTLNAPQPELKRCVDSTARGCLCAIRQLTKSGPGRPRRHLVVWNSRLSGTDANNLLKTRDNKEQSQNRHNRQISRGSSAFSVSGGLRE